MFQNKNAIICAFKSLRDLQPDFAFSRKMLVLASLIALVFMTPMIATAQSPPVLTLDPPIPVEGHYSVAEGSTLTIVVSAIDPDTTDSLTVSVTSLLPAGATFESGTFSWTPDFNQAGSHEVTFEASDTGGTASETITIEVQNVNRPPVLDPIGNKAVDEGVELTFLVTALDPDGDTVTIKAKDLPSGATFTPELTPGTWNFTWTPGFGQAGSYTVTFNATDPSDAVDEETITISVGNTITITVNDDASQLIDDLIYKVGEYEEDGFIDNKGIANSLIAKLDAAKAQLESGNTKAAGNMLKAFINHVEAQHGKKNKHIDEDTAHELIKDAETILAQL